MKICYFIPSLYNSGGMERVLTVKANYLVENFGHNVWIVTSEQFNRPIYYQLNKKISVKHFDIPLHASYPHLKLLSYFFYQKSTKKFKNQLSDFLKEEKFDICVSMAEGREFHFLPDLKDGSVKIAEFHFSNFYFTKNFAVGNIIKKVWRKILYRKFSNAAKKYKHFVVLTNQDKEEWEQYLNNVITIYNPLTLENRSLSLLDSKIALSVGRLTSQKGFDLLIESWEIVNASRPDWTLLIVGSGAEEHNLKNAIISKKLEKHIKILPPTTQITDVYKNASLYIMSSRYEGLPLVLMEAMSFGLPAISFDCKYGPSELIDDGITGKIVENGNVEALADGISKLLNDRALLKEMGKNAYAKSSKYTLEEIMPVWNNLFSALINKQ